MGNSQKKFFVFDFGAERFAFSNLHTYTRSLLRSGACSCAVSLHFLLSAPQRPLFRSFSLLHSLFYSSPVSSLTSVLSFLHKTEHEGFSAFFFLFMTPVSKVVARVFFVFRLYPVLSCISHDYFVSVHEKKVKMDISGSLDTVACSKILKGPTLSPFCFRFSTVVVVPTGGLMLCSGVSNGNADGARDRDK